MMIVMEIGGQKDIFLIVKMECVYGFAKSTNRQLSMGDGIILYTNLMI
jgi:hypothetical protein